MYLGWFDDNPKKAAALKIQEAIYAYTERFKSQPNVVLVNEADVSPELGGPGAGLKGVVVRSASFIRRNNFWVGKEDIPSA
jgi:hypothetical protein